MNKIFDYKNLTLIELIEKISTARFFHLPKMVAEAFRKLNSTPSYEPPYKVYTALLTQTGTSAPTAVVLENTLGGDVTYNYVGVGNYEILSDEIFVENKTAMFHKSLIADSDTYRMISYYLDSSTIGLSMSDAGTPTNNLISISSETIEIRVYS